MKVPHIVFIVPLHSDSGNSYFAKVLEAGLSDIGLQSHSGPFWQSKTSPLADKLYYSGHVFNIFLDGICLTGITFTYAFLHLDNDEYLIICYESKN